MVRLLKKICAYDYTIHTIPGSINFMSRFPRKECKIPEMEMNVPFCHQVRRIMQGTKGGLRINQILVNMALYGR